MRDKTFLAVTIGGVAVGGFIVWRHSRQGKVSNMKAPFKAEIFPYTLKSRHVSSPFGAKRKTGPHSGIDLRTLFQPMVKDGIRMPNIEKPSPNGIPGIGLELRSPVDGVVDGVLNGGPGGKELIVEADDGTRIGFSHLFERFVEKGQRVSAGEVIALCGDTGTVTGPHLHMTVRNRDGKLVDPAPYLGL
jgi:murein DD-endopeptidase MepM/ murein hydrolase activator NlpD